MDVLPTETTYDSAVAHLTRSAGAARELARWLGLPGKAPVADFARALTSRHAYEITPGMVEEACARASHALAWENGSGLRRAVAESVGRVVDWYPDFPIVHTLYFAIEHFRRPPLWHELREEATVMLGCLLANV